VRLAYQADGCREVEVAPVLERPFPSDGQPASAASDASVVSLREASLGAAQVAAVPLRDDAEKWAAHVRACRRLDAVRAARILAPPSALLDAPAEEAQCKPAVVQSAE
jgi:hypothetical protein